MKILITSDSHDRWDHLRSAVDVGNEHDCEVMLFAGDLIAPGGVNVLQEFKGSVHFVLGNNEGELIGLTQLVSETKNVALEHKFGQSYLEKEFDGLKFFMNHFPKHVRHAALSGEYDVCIYGHDHIYHEEKIANGTLLLNPGELQGFKTGEPTCMILDTEDKSVLKVTL